MSEVQMEISAYRATIQRVEQECSQWAEKIAQAGQLKKIPVLIEAKRLINFARNDLRHLTEMRTERERKRLMVEFLETYAELRSIYSRMITDDVEAEHPHSYLH